MEEYQQITFGLTLNQVEKIIGSKGELQSSKREGQNKTEIYRWKGNAFVSYASVTFQNDTVIGMTQIGLPIGDF